MSHTLIPLWNTGCRQRLPIIIISPMGTLKAAAANNGPGVGGTSECAMVPPAIIAITQIA
ncbi:MAG: hypothetical protein WDN75_21255 [Bacteroidota bacterium]